MPTIVVMRGRLVEIYLEEPTHWKGPWCWERLKAKGEEGGRGRHLLNSITDSIDTDFSRLWKIVKDRDAWYAAVHGVAKIRTRLSGWTMTNILRGPEFWISFIRSHKLFPVPIDGIMGKGIYRNKKFSINWSLLSFFWPLKNCTMNGEMFSYDWKWAMSPFFCIIRGITALLYHMAMGFATAFWCLSLSPRCSWAPVSLAHCSHPPLHRWFSLSLFLVVYSCDKTVFPYETY